MSLGTADERETAWTMAKGQGSSIEKIVTYHDPVRRYTYIYITCVCEFVGKCIETGRNNQANRNEQSATFSLDAQLKFDEIWIGLVCFLVNMTLGAGGWALCIHFSLSSSLIPEVLTTLG